jgi:hypothetical protein
VRWGILAPLFCVTVMSSLMPMIGVLILFAALGNYDRVTASRPSSPSLQG